SAPRIEDLNAGRGRTSQPVALGSPVGDQGLRVRHGAPAELATRQHGVVSTGASTRSSPPRGLPAPAMNYFVEGYEIDAYWADHRFGVELDVYATHGSRLSFEEDRDRTETLLPAGIETTRVTGPRLAREPEAVVDSVRRHLARRGAA